MNDENQSVEYGEPVTARVIRPDVRFDLTNLLHSPATWLLIGAVGMYLIMRKRL